MQLPPLGKTNHKTLRIDFAVRWPFSSPYSKISRPLEITGFEYMNIFLQPQLDTKEHRIPVDSVSEKPEGSILCVDSQFILRTKALCNKRNFFFRSIRRPSEETSCSLARCHIRYSVSFKIIRSLCKSNARQYRMNLQQVACPQAWSNKAFIFQYMGHLKGMLTTQLAIRNTQGIST